MPAPLPLLPSRSRSFRWITILSAAAGSFALGYWGLNFFFADGLASPIGRTLGTAIAALCALAAAGTASAFFAGVRESAEYVFRETHFDKLTGLFNRPAMVGRLAEAVMSTSYSGKPAFLVDIDIDRFKQINDGIGYGAGDELIKALSERLSARLQAKFGRSGVEVGRIGAGEFAVILPDRPGLDMEAVIEDLIADLKRPYQLSTHLQAVNLSVGIVASPKDGTDPMLLLRRSNLALQHARATGSGGWAVFNPAMGRAADRRQWIESELQTAFERGDFDLHYQPQFDLATSEVVGYEALIRWQHPERGAISPVEFIPVAEETGMIVPLGEWVLRKACRDARHLPDDCAVAVNISAVQFSTRDFLGCVRDALRESRLDPSRLELEVTETAMTQDRERAAEILNGLAAMGISVAVDDFGTGYSNLSSLIDFPFKKLKIDRSFVSRLETDASSGAVVSTIVGLSRALGVRTVAEGVETPEQAMLLRAAGCETVQGFLYGRPAPLARPQAQARRRAALH